MNVHKQFFEVYEVSVGIIIIIVVIFKCYFSGENIALSIKKNNNNGVNIE